MIILKHAIFYLLTQQNLLHECLAILLLKKAHRKWVLEEEKTKVVKNFLVKTFEKLKYYPFMKCKNKQEPHEVLLKKEKKKPKRENIKKE